MSPLVPLFKRGLLVHILTKIFIVLVTLLAVAMVPLVATYTTNENSYRAKYRAADDQQRLAMIRAGDAESALFAQRVQMQNEIDARDATIGSMRSVQTSTRASMESLRAQIGRLESQLSQSNANLQALSSASEVNSALKERFVTENYTLRENVIDAERMIMEIEDLLEDTRLEAQGALRAERKAQEERHDLEEQIDAMQSRLIAYVSKFGELETVAAIDNGLAPDRTIASTVLTVSRANDDVLVEINAGSRDGVQKGWIMTVGQDGTFLGRLQVEQVDINRSIGRVTLEDPTRGLVVPGSSVYAVKGRN
jgi:cell shape-determining protein MreC